MGNAARFRRAATLPAEGQTFLDKNGSCVRSVLQGQPAEGTAIAIRFTRMHDSHELAAQKFAQPGLGLEALLELLLAVRMQRLRCIDIFQPDLHRAARAGSRFLACMEELACRRQ